MTAEKDTYRRYETHHATRHTTDHANDAGRTLYSREERCRSCAAEEKRERDDQQTHPRRGFPEIAEASILAACSTISASGARRSTAALNVES